MLGWLHGMQRGRVLVSGVIALLVMLMMGVMVAPHTIGAAVDDEAAVGNFAPVLQDEDDSDCIEDADEDDDNDCDEFADEDDDEIPEDDSDCVEDADEDDDDICNEFEEDQEDEDCPEDPDEDDDADCDVEEPDVPGPTMDGRLYGMAGGVNAALGAVYRLMGGGLVVYAIDPVTAVGTYEFEVSQTALQTGIQNAVSSGQPVLLGQGRTGNALYAAQNGQCVFLTTFPDGKPAPFIFDC